MQSRWLAALLLLGFGLAASTAQAAACGCKDLAKIRQELARTTAAVEAWKQIFGWARGLRPGPLPSSNDALNQKFAHLMATPSESWEADWSTPARADPGLQQIAGLNSLGEPVISSDFRAANCDGIVEAEVVHENAHREFFLRPGNVLKQSALGVKPGPIGRALGLNPDVPINHDVLLYLRAESEVESYRAHMAYLWTLEGKVRDKCKRVSFKGVTVDCVMSMGGRRLRIGQKLEGETCGDPLTSSWTIRPTYFVEPGAPQSTGNKPFEDDCVAPGSEADRRAAIHRSFRASGGGGWICLYEATPTPRITIWNFRLKQCEGAAEQRITVDAAVSSEACGGAAPEPPGPRPRTGGPNS